MRADTIIVGSGVAAVTLAQRLLAHDRNASILILEAGGKVKMRDFALYQNYVVTGGLPYQLYYDLPAPTRGQQGENHFTGNAQMELQGARLMMYGGSTVHWDGYSFRFKPEDFRLHSNTGQGIDWPIDYADLEPYYSQAEDHLGVSGDSQERIVPRSRPYPFRQFPYSLEDTLAIEAFDQLGISYSHLPIARHGMADTTSPYAPCQTTGTCLYCPFGARYNAANVLDNLRTLQSHPNLEVRTNAVVESILMRSRTRARGVRYLDRNTGAHVVAEAKTVIVASGTVESPKLLLRSVSSHWKHGLGNQHDLVGRNIVTHPWLTYTSTLPANPLKMQPEMAFPTLVSRHYDNRREQPKGKYLLFNPPTSPLINLASAMQQGKTRPEIERLVRGEIPIQFNAMFEVFSRHENRVTNYDKISHLGMIEATIHYDTDSIVRRQLVAVENKVREIFRAMGAKGKVTANVSWGAHHASCSTRMSADPGLGVVDADMRIHGVDNVYICSNASFSTLSAVNPTLTLTALALRLGDLLGRRP